MYLNSGIIIWMLWEYDRWPEFYTLLYFWHKVDVLSLVFKHDSTQSRATCWRWAPASLPKALFPWLDRLLWEEKGCQGRLVPLLDVWSRGCKLGWWYGGRDGGRWQERGVERGISCSESWMELQNGVWGQRIRQALRKTSASVPSSTLSKTPAFPTSSTFHERTHW